MRVIRTPVGPVSTIMIAWTRRSALAVAIALLSAGCAMVDTSTSAPPAAARPSGTAAAATIVPTARAAPTASSSSIPTAAPTGTVADIARLEAAVAADPRDAGSQRDLGFALLQRIRETADPTLYAPAAAAFEAARTLAPDDALVLVGIGGLQLGKHEFADALVSGRQAVVKSPRLATAHAVVVDALVELGRYDEAQTAADDMLGVSLDRSTLTRASYIAELHGQLDAALSAMRMAAEAPSAAPENVAFVDALLGNLLVYTGDPAAAAKAYQDALAVVPAHAPSLAGEARLAVGAGKLDEAIALFRRAADILPLPEYVIALGEAQTAAGRMDDATRSFKLASAEIRLFQASGVVVDLDLALFEADHGDPPGAGLRADGLQGDADRSGRRRAGLGAPSVGARGGGQEALGRGAAARIARPALALSRRGDRRRARATSRTPARTWTSPSRPTPDSRRPAPPKRAGSSPRFPDRPGLIQTPRDCASTIEPAALGSRDSAKRSRRPRVLHHKPGSI